MTLKEFKSTRTIYIVPIIFIVLFTAATITAGVLLRNASAKNIIWGVSLPLVFLILSIIYVVRLYNAPNTSLKIDKEKIYVNDHPIMLSDIKVIDHKTDIFVNQKLVIITKSNEVYYINHLSDVVNVEKEIKRKYLRSK